MDDLQWCWGYFLDDLFFDVAMRQIRPTSTTTGTIIAVEFYGRIDQESRPSLVAGRQATSGRLYKLAPVLVDSLTLPNNKIAQNE